jgi:hypothetical protein
VMNSPTDRLDVVSYVVLVAESVETCWRGQNDEGYLCRMVLGSKNGTNGKSRWFITKGKFKKTKGNVVLCSAWGICYEFCLQSFFWFAYCDIVYVGTNKVGFSQGLSPQQKPNRCPDY